MEKIPPKEKTPAEQQVARWKSGHTILASSSLFRLKQLENVGFSDVDSTDSIPESVETDVANTMAAQDGAPRTHWDSDGMNFSEHIAAAKVRYILNQVQTDTETLVVGFDTTAVIYTDPTDEQPKGVPKSAEKYTTLDDAKHGMLKRFKIVSEGIVDQQNKISQLRHIQEQIGGSDEEVESTLEWQRGAIKRGHIYVTTGVAVGFPHEHDTVQRFSEEVQLFSESIANTEGNEQALEKLVDLIIETQGEEKTLSISGGIDYADSYIRDILQLQEFIPAEKPVTAEALYHGFAPKALEVILRAHAENMQRSEAA